jgi:Spy/CpxP family protein refolding chaperone
MISIRKSATLSILGFLFVLAGCGSQAGGSDVTQPGVAAQAELAPAIKADVTPVKFEHGFRRGGPDMLLRTALHAPINLTAEQKSTIEGALKELAPKPGTEKPNFDRSQHAKELAAAVRSGKVESVGIGQKNEQFAKFIESRRAAMAKAITTLHSTLTKEQRSALVDSINARSQKMANAMKEGKFEHKFEGKALDGKENSERMARRGDHEGGRPGFGNGFLQDLDLTQAQKDAIHAKLSANKPSEADHEAMKAKWEAARKDRTARLATFVEDKFDATAFLARKPDGASPKAAGPLPEGQRVNRLAVIVSVLDPAQREKLAARIEQGPTTQKQQQQRVRTPELPRTL